MIAHLFYGHIPRQGEETMWILSMTAVLTCAIFGCIGFGLYMLGVIK